MNSQSSNTGLLFVGVLLAAVFLFVNRGPATPVVPAPPDEPLPVTTLSLAEAFAANPDAAERRVHAADLRKVLGVTIAGIEFDARQPASERIFYDGAHLDQHIVVTRKFYAHEWTFHDHYPALGEDIEAFLRERLGNYLSGALTDSARREWVAALREVQAAAAAVEGGR